MKEEFIFLVEGEIELLWKCIENYISIGHQEFARAIFSDLVKKDKERAVSYLNNLLEHGFPAQCASLKDRSHIYLLWMFVQESLLIQSPSSEVLLLSKRIQFDFNILESISSLELTPSISDFYYFLRNYYYLLITEQLDSLEEFTEEIEVQLRKVFTKIPLLTHSICKKMIQYDIKDKDTYYILYDNQTKLLNVFMDCIEKTLSREDFDLLEHQLSFFDLFPNLNSLSKTLVSRIEEFMNSALKCCEREQIRILKGSLASSSDKPNPRLLYQRVYQGLLASNNTELITLFSQIQDEFFKNSSLYHSVQFRKLNNDIDPVIAELLLNRNLSNNEFWQRFMQYMRIHQEHLFEYILSNSIKLLKQGNITLTKQFLYRTPILQPIVLIVAWSEFAGNILELQQIVEQFKLPITAIEGDDNLVEYSDSSNTILFDQKIADSCCLLSYHIRLSIWCARKLWKSYSTSSREFNNCSYLSGITKSSGKNKAKENVNIIAGRILQDLRQHSLLYVLQHAFECKEIVVEELYHLLSPETQDSWTTKQSKNSNFLEIASFCIISSSSRIINQWYLTTSENDKDLSYEFEQELPILLSTIKKSFHQMNHIPLKLRLLETILSFLFLPYLGNNIKSDRNLDFFVLKNVLELLFDILDSTKTSNSSKYDSHIQELENIIKESLWRLKLLESDNTKKKFNTNLWQLWTSSPSTLLINQLKERKFENCNEISGFYSLPEDIVSIANRTEAVVHVRQALSVKQPDDSQANAIIESFPLKDTPESIATWEDLLITTPVSPSISSYLLSKLPHSEKNEQFGKCIQLLDSSLYTLLQTTSFVNQDSSCIIPSESTALKYKSLWHQYDIICKQSPLDIVLTEQQLQQLKGSIDKNNNEDDEEYFSQFIDLLLKMIKIIHPNIQSGCDVSLNFVKNSPDELIGQFIYQNEDYTRAESLAKLFDRDLMIGVIESIKRNIVGDDNSSVSLTESIVEYFQSQSPIIALLACIYKHQTTLFPSEFLNRAKNIESSTNSSTLKQWLQTILDEFKYFSEYYYSNSIKDDGMFSLDCSKEVFTEEQHELYQKLVNDSNNKDLIAKEYFEMLIDLYIKQANFEKALNLSEKFIEEGPSDELLKKFIGQDPVNSWKFIFRLKDKKLASSFVFSNLEHWSIEVCLEILNMLSQYSNECNDLPKKQIDAITQELLIYQKILQYSSSLQLNNESIGWQDIASMCRQNPSQMVAVLTKDKNFDLARSVALLFAPEAAVQRTIEQEFLLARMRSIETSEYSTISTLLIELGNESLPICEGIIDSLKIPIFPSHVAPTNEVLDAYQKEIEQFLEIQLFLVQYMISCTSDDKYLEQYTIDILLQKQIGLKLLSDIPIDSLEPYLHLSNYPNLIIEGLIVSEQTMEVSRLLQKYPQLRDDKVILFYCEKSMQISSKNIQDNSSFSSVASHSSLRQIRRDFTAVRHSTETVRRLKKLSVKDEHAQQAKNRNIRLTGEASDQQVREDFQYPNAPNIRLFKALVSLCSQQKLAGEKCLDLANQLSSTISSSSDPLFVTDIIQQVILTGKLLLLEAGLSTEICDGLLDHLVLIQSLIVRECSVYYSLLDFTDTRKMEQLRDKLIKEDHIQLALDVSEKCNLDPYPVRASWGLALLKRGEYSKAKEIFSLCLKENVEVNATPNTSSRRRSSSTNAKLQHQTRIVNDIVKILEKKPLKDSGTVREEQRNSVRRRLMNIQNSSSSSSGNKKNQVPKRVPLNQLDTERYMQCIYYLTRFGNPEDCLAFWVRHSLYEDAIRFILQRRLPSKFFTEVSMRIIHSRGLSYLHLKVLKIVDPELELSKDYLLRFCATLSSMSAHQALLDTQLFMKDNIRAGLTCVSRAKKDFSNLNTQMKYLQIAEVCFFIKKILIN